MTSIADSVRGTVAPGYEPVRDVFQSFFDKQWDTGSCVSVYRGGAPIVQLTGGRRMTADDSVVPYDASTIQLVASTTKFVESVCIALLVDRGLFGTTTGSSIIGLSLQADTREKIASRSANS